MLLLSIPIIRLLISLNNWRYLEKAKKKHRLYITGIPDQASDEDKKQSKQAANWLTSNLIEIKQKVEQAGVGNPTRIVMEPAGYGHVAQQSISALDNLLFHNKEILAQASNALSIAAGSYRTQTIQSVNPLYWLEVLFFLPKWFVSSTGIEITSKVAEVSLRIVQILYWVIIILAFIFRPELFEFLLGSAKT